MTTPAQMPATRVDGHPAWARPFPDPKQWVQSPEHLPVTVRAATQDDLRGVMALLEGAAGWMRSVHHNHAWPQGGFPAERIEPGVEAGTVWLVTAGASELPWATVTLDQHPDVEFDAAGLDPVSAGALVVHRLAVLRKSPHQPQGWCQIAPPKGVLGGYLLDVAEDLAAARGLTWVWLNCAREAAPLHAYYAGQGFEHITTVRVGERRSGSLWRRPVAARV